MTKNPHAQALDNSATALDDGVILIEPEIGYMTNIKFIQTKVIKNPNAVALDRGATKNSNAVALGRLGGLVGGKARARAMTPEQRSEAARKAGSAPKRPRKPKP